MIVAGTLVEVGQLDDEGTLGAVFQRSSGERITIKGLTLDETRAVVQSLFQPVVIKVAVGAPP